jgi:hypothetical protein
MSAPSRYVVIEGLAIWRSAEFHDDLAAAPLGEDGLPQMELALPLEEAVEADLIAPRVASYVAAAMKMLERA